ncbi:NADH-quinone oxidoreductase subunit M [Thalassotalea sp. HSM 43]|uniref:complex I subunit 4 family protein n=1 Tax=Thalassotalea sp. HSM 43 TaxID=2552945 RepID=UPI001081D023|nr:NADH-quinone oxidoreductase subunit M [Thalassotalea sp. HSM 43]QBY05513.1 NADH-quinone oxidoreductase subunit M [Thalassotalea sp. HSM 43]
MILTQIIIILMIGAVIAWAFDFRRPGTGRWIALFSLVMASITFIDFASSNKQLFHGFMHVTEVDWIEAFNIHYATGIDSLSFILIALTLLLGFICVLVSWQEIHFRQGFYYFNLLAALAGIVGVFIATDLFLFFFFWEVMLIPMTILIVIWGHENRIYAAIKFFIFTQASSLLMLIAIVAMAFLHKQYHGELSFDLFALKTMNLPADMGMYMMLGFFIAFAVKLPSFPVHTWLPDAHTQAPTAGSVLLAGVLLKTGAYGLIRFVIELFPRQSHEFAYVAATLGTISILYGAKMAFAQTDFKRLVAYSSISHMGFVMLALFSFNQSAYHGALLTLIAHGLSSGALFAMAGMLYSRLHTRDLTQMGGLFASAPQMGAMLLAFVAAAFGMPGLLNFVGEFLILTGAFSVFPVLVVVSAAGLIGSAVYGMRLFQTSFQGPVNKQVIDLSGREFIICVSLLSLLLILGVYPEFIFSHFPDNYPVVLNESMQPIQSHLGSLTAQPLPGANL